MPYASSIMPKKIQPSSAFGQRLYELRKARGLTQIDLAKALGTSQRAVSYYETVADFPPAETIVQLAKILGVHVDELLGTKRMKIEKEDPETQRLWKKFRQVLELPEKDRRAIIRMINSLVAAQRSAPGA